MLKKQIGYILIWNLTNVVDGSSQFSPSLSISQPSSSRAQFEIFPSHVTRIAAIQNTAAQQPLETNAVIWICRLHWSQRRIYWGRLDIKDPSRWHPRCRPDITGKGMVSRSELRTNIFIWFSALRMGQSKHFGFRHEMSSLFARWSYLVAESTLLVKADRVLLDGGLWELLYEEGGDPESCCIFLSLSSWSSVSILNCWQISIMHRNPFWLCVAPLTTDELT